MDIGALTSVSSQSLSRLENSFTGLPALGRGASVASVSCFTENSLLSLLSRLPREVSGKPFVVVSEISDLLSNLVARVSDEIPLVNRLLEELNSLVSTRPLSAAGNVQFPTLDDLADQLRLETRLGAGSSPSGMVGQNLSSMANTSFASFLSQISEKFDDFSTKVGLKARFDDTSLFAESPKTLNVLASGSPYSQSIPGQTSAELTPPRFQSVDRFFPANARAIPYEKRPARETKQKSALSRLFRRFLQKGESLLKTLFKRDLQS